MPVLFQPTLSRRVLHELEQRGPGDYQLELGQRQAEELSALRYSPFHVLHQSGIREVGSDVYLWECRVIIMVDKPDYFRLKRLPK